MVALLLQQYDDGLGWRQSGDRLAESCAPFLPPKPHGKIMALEGLFSPAGRITSYQRLNRLRRCIGVRVIFKTRSESLTSLLRILLRILLSSLLSSVMFWYLASIGFSPYTTEEGEGWKKRAKHQLCCKRQRTVAKYIMASSRWIKVLQI
jgi:hypothetical protein